MALSFLDTQTGAAVIGALAGIALTTVVQIYLRRRGLCTYSVNHNRAAVSVDDPIFGSVRVTWQGTEVGNLYVSVAELRNESINDYENVSVRIYSANTTLLNERTVIVGTPNILTWSDDYSKQLAPDSEGNITEIQWNMYFGQREYTIPVFNRGEKVRFEFVNIAKDIAEQPEIWMSIVHKGLNLKFRVPQPEMFGVPHRWAALVGLLVCALTIIPFTYHSVPLMSAGLLSFLLGVFVIVPGALLIKAVSWLKRQAVG